MSEVTLRAYRIEDAADIVAACNDPQLLRFLPFLPSPYTHEDAVDWVRNRVPTATAAGDTIMAITGTDTDRLQGSIGIHQRGEGCAELGYWVAPWARGKGLATVAVRVATATAFDRGIHRLYLRTEPENVASQRVAIAAGYTRESVQRGSGANRDGVGRHDLIVWARLATDQEGPTRRLLPDLPGRTASHRGQLTDGVIILSPLGPADAADTFDLHALPDVIATSVPAASPSRAEIDRRCGHAEAAWLAGNRADLTIRDAASGAFAGEIGLYFWEPSTGQAMIGYSMVPAWRGRGYATRAATLITEWAFGVGVARMIAGTAPENVGSQRVLERAGFVREGYQRSRLPGPNGTRIDDMLYARLP